MSLEEYVFFDISIGGHEMGRIVFRLFDSVVPLTAANFRALAIGSENALGQPIGYEGSTFHRIVEGAAIHGGDFVKGDGSGGESIYGRAFRDENFKLKHAKGGLLSMSNVGPHTNSSQFFITTAPAPWLDGRQVVFGEVVKGSEVVKRIESVAVNFAKRPMQEVKITKSGTVEAI